MEKSINKNLSLGECVIIYPAVVEKFNDIGLDYCCGGNKNLEIALKEKNINVDKFIEDINEELEEFIFDNSSYINHARTFELLRDIDPLLVRVFKVHYNHLPDVLTRVHKLFGALKCELEEHLIKEEKILFPKIIEFENTNDKEKKDILKVEIERFIGEHEAAGDILKELAQITDDYSAPEWACTSFKLLYMKMHDLEKDLFVHIHKENNILFKRYQ